MALVSAVDIFATVAELANVELDDPSVYPHDRELDSISLVPYLNDPGIASMRRINYAERFFENTKQGAQPDLSQYNRQHVCQEDVGYASTDSSARLIVCGGPPVHNTGNQSNIWLEGLASNAEVFLLAGGFKPSANPLFDGLVTVSTISFNSLQLSSGKSNLNLPMISDGFGSLLIPGLIHQKNSPQDFYLQAAVQDPISLEWSLSNALFVNQSDNAKALRTTDGFKLVSYVSSGQEELYFLPDDLDEQADLLATGVAGLTLDQSFAYERLRKALGELLASENADLAEQH
ncbi:MAG: hypothetical protein JKX85_08845 [Phycisphaeraceae bacterium]|nr:hypothetical protein [Phycisphaeraceae bacterium]